MVSMTKTHLKWWIITFGVAGADGRYTVLAQQRSGGGDR